MCTIFRLNITQNFNFQQHYFRKFMNVAFICAQIHYMYFQLDLFISSCFTEIIGYEKFTITTLYFFLRRILFITGYY